MHTFSTKLQGVGKSGMTIAGFCLETDLVCSQGCLSAAGARSTRCSMLLCKLSSGGWVSEEMGKSLKRASSPDHVLQPGNGQKTISLSSRQRRWNMSNQMFFFSFGSRRSLWIRTRNPSAARTIAMGQNSILHRRGRFSHSTYVISSLFRPKRSPGRCR
jgi:hypothetical protein